MVRNAFREILICLLNPELVSSLFIASSSLNLTNFYIKPGTDWVEPALIWLTISMPTGSRKTTVYQFL